MGGRGSGFATNNATFTQFTVSEPNSWTATVRDETGRFTRITSEYTGPDAKKDFIKDLRSNGYTVQPSHVKQTEIYNYIVDETKTGGDKFDWKHINTEADVREHMKDSGKFFLSRIR